MASADVPSGTAAAPAVQDGSPAEKLIWYFAIGSMMNNTSMNLRDLFPKQSQPAILRGWKLKFRGRGGMADIEKDDTASFHGVLHLLTESDFSRLDAIEGLYLRTPVQAETYDGERVDAFAYKMDENRRAADPNWLDLPPGERYLDIIIRGAEAHGVKPEYIEQVLRKVETTPRKTVEEYRSLAVPDVVIPRAEFDAATGCAEGESWDPCRPLMICLNGKVLRWASEPLTVPARSSYVWNRRNWVGKGELALHVARLAYEPLYGIPTTLENMSPQARAWVEELFVSFTLQGDTPAQGFKIGHWEGIGWLEGSEPERLKKASP